MNNENIKIKTTFGHILDTANWDKFCDMFGINPWCINEGLAQSSEEIELTIEQAKEIGLNINY